MYFVYNKYTMWFIDLKRTKGATVWGTYTKTCRSVGCKRRAWETGSGTQVHKIDKHRGLDVGACGPEGLMDVIWC